MKESSDITDFSHFYTSWYSRATRFAIEYVADEYDAENIVQDVFLRLYELWDNAKEPRALSSSYLIAAIKNRCLDHLRSRMSMLQAKNQYHTELEDEVRFNYDSLESFHPHLFENISAEELLARALDKLPEKCRRIFIMNKIEHKKQKQIAQELDISVNTIESQMAIAWKKIKEELRFAPHILAIILQAYS